MGESWKERVSDDVDKIVARHCDDALDEELLGEIAAVAMRRMHTLKVQAALRVDPYGELTPMLARKLASRLSVRSLERTRTRHESRVTSQLTLRPSTDAPGRDLRIHYEASAGVLRYVVTLTARDPSKKPTTILEVDMCCQQPRQPRIRFKPAGCRNLCNAARVGVRTTSDYRCALPGWHGVGR